MHNVMYANRAVLWLNYIIR